MYQDLLMVLLVLISQDLQRLLVQLEVHSMTNTEQWLVLHLRSMVEEPLLAQLQTWLTQVDTQVILQHPQPMPEALAQLLDMEEVAKPLDTTTMVVQPEVQAYQLQANPPLTLLTAQHALEVVQQVELLLDTLAQWVA